MKAIEYVEKLRAGQSKEEVLGELNGEMHKIIKDRRAQLPSSKFGVFKECRTKWQSVVRECNTIEPGYVQEVDFEAFVVSTNPEFGELIKAQTEIQMESMRNARKHLRR